MNDTVVVSQLGARMHYAVPRILHAAGRLERLYTDLCATRGWPVLLHGIPGTILPASVRRLRGRVPQGVPTDRIVHFPRLGLESVLKRMARPDRARDTSVALDAGQRFSTAVVRRGFGRAGGFYGISGECLEQLRSARAQGLWTAVEQIIAPREMVDRLVAREVERHPRWQETVADDPLAQDYAAREKAEWDCADVVICPSDFVLQGVREAGGPVGRCVIVPYGFDARFGLAHRRVRRDGPLRVLTVGAVGLRKGSPYVLEAARLLRNVARFRMVGPFDGPAHIEQELRQELQFLGQVPRAEIARHYAWADVFLLPSVCEGSATVVYEALAAGLPVITTPNAGSVVRHGVDGFICKAGSVGPICDAVTMLSEDRDLLDAMSRAALATAAEYDLASYGSRLLAALAPLSSPRLHRAE